MACHDFGDRVTGRVLDTEWLLARPRRSTSGVVVAIYPYAKDIVGIRADDGSTVDVKVAR